MLTFVRGYPDVFSLTPTTATTTATATAVSSSSSSNSSSSAPVGQAAASGEVAGALEWAEEEQAEETGGCGVLVGVAAGGLRVALASAKEKGDCVGAAHLLTRLRGASVRCCYVLSPVLLLLLLLLLVS